MLCEDGENEYDPALLKRSNSVLEPVEAEADFTPEHLLEFEKKHKPGADHHRVQRHVEF